MMKAHSSRSNIKITRGSKGRTRICSVVLRDTLLSDQARILKIGYTRSGSQMLPQQSFNLSGRRTRPMHRKDLRSALGTQTRLIHSSNALLPLRVMLCSTLEGDISLKIWRRKEIRIYGSIVSVVYVFP